MLTIGKVYLDTINILYGSHCFFYTRTCKNAQWHVFEYLNLKKDRCTFGYRLQPTVYTNTLCKLSKLKQLGAFFDL